MKHVLANTTPTPINTLCRVDQDVSGIVKRTTYINYSNQDVVVLDRIGLYNRITPVINVFTNRFIVRTEYYIPYTSFREIAGQLATDISTSTYGDISVIKQRFFEDYDELNPHYRTIRAVSDTIVEMPTIVNNGSVYLTNHDIVLTVERNLETVKHPFCDFSLMQERFKELTAMSGSSFTFEVVDNENTIGDRFCYIAKKVYRVKPFADHGRESGIYFTVNDGYGCTTLKYELTDQLSVGLYKTQEEAASGGDLKLLKQEEIMRVTHENTINNLTLQKMQQEYKAEIERLKYEAAKQEHSNKVQIGVLDLKVKELEKENKLLEQRNREIKAKFDRKKYKLDKKLNQKKKNYEVKKIKSTTSNLEQKDYYAERSFTRQDSVDKLKTIGAVIAAGLTIVGLVSKFK